MENYNIVPWRKCAAVSLETNPVEEVITDKPHAILSIFGSTESDGSFHSQSCHVHKPLLTVIIVNMLLDDISQG